MHEQHFIRVVFYFVHAFEFHYGSGRETAYFEMVFKELWNHFS